MTEVKLGRDSLVTGCFIFYFGWAKICMGLGRGVRWAGKMGVLVGLFVLGFGLD